ncbi:hypothetical protein HFZ78_01960 [Priestia megaterium]|uniref:Uncharacterized protein n=1 Tax=Priestia megaterium TaxID=1404 RepID=A0A6H1NWL3_PRIMG|nr:hypothetical protein [Priestia megaterium]QIZ05658.1 hypothetical protein HFZ78_01960 [Priestia megaterium]
MDRTVQTNSSNVSNFSEIVRKAYETGKNEKGITPEKLIADLTADLKNLMAV